MTEASDRAQPVATRRNQRPLKVMMIAPTSFFSDYGGHIRILEETLALQARGHQVCIVTYYKGRDLDGIDIRRTAPLPWNSDYEVGSSRHKLAFDVYLAQKSLAVALDFRPDVIHGHMHEGTLIGGVLSKLLRKPLVFDFQGSLTGEMIDHGFLDPHGSVFPWMMRMERGICAMPQAILTSSLRAQRLLTERFRVPENKIVPLPDCVDMKRFDAGRFSAEQRKSLKKQLGIPADRTVIAYLGLLADYQGTHHLVRAARILKDEGYNAHFLIMGYPKVDKYKELARELDVTNCVTFTGRVQYDDAPLYLSLGDIAVSAKMSSTEGSGKVLNYMALGQPVVAYDSQVHREYLDIAGVYPASGDVEAFSAELAHLIDHPDRCRDLGLALHQRAREEYSWEAAASRIESLYYSLLNPSRVTA